MVIRAIDLCCGAGGWACAAAGLPIKIELAVDRWDDACATYAMNFPLTDVRCCDLMDPLDLADFHGIDLVLGAIPCEWLSSFRTLERVKDHEIAEGQSLIGRMLEIVADLSPSWWVLEDVVQVIGHLPIFTPYQVIESKHYSPQRRKRAFVGHFPPPVKSRNREAMRDRLRPGPYRIGKRCLDRVPATARTFSNKCTLAAIPDRKSPTILSLSSRRDAEMAIVDDQLPGGKRQVEWQEAARLQGFPESFMFVGSPSDAAKMVGQAIQIDTGRAILQGIVNEWQTRNGGSHGSR